MKKFVIFFSFFLLSSSSSSSSSNKEYEEYLKQRSSFLYKENQLSINSAWKLTKNEEIVNNKLSLLLQTENSFSPSNVEFSFIYQKENITKSELFQFLKEFPKGALLHSHDTSAQDMKLYLEASYLSNCLYSLRNDESYGALSFLNEEGYVPISTIRNNW